MSKLYVGNLPSDCNESALRQLFQEHSLACTTILVKRGGYAFVDCADQSTADRAIDKLNGAPTSLIICILIKRFYRFAAYAAAFSPSLCQLLLRTRVSRTSRMRILTKNRTCVNDIICRYIYLSF
ncbi:hypothetical protein ACFW04_005043 [Cataglyphis niger]